MYVIGDTPSSVSVIRSPSPCNVIHAQTAIHNSTMQDTMVRKMLALKIAPVHAAAQAFSTRNILAEVRRVQRYRQHMTT